MTCPVNAANPSPSTASRTAANGQTASAGYPPTADGKASPSVSISVEDVPDPTTSREAALQAVTISGILAAELFSQLYLPADEPDKTPSLTRVNILLSLAEQMHQHSGEAVNALAELQNEAFHQQK